MFEFRLPENMRTTDFKVFEALSGMLLTTIKNETDKITDLKDPYKTPDHMLPTLANFLGAFYESRTIPLVNRDLLYNWWWAIKNKGTRIAIEIMAALALKAYDAKSNNPNPLSMYNRTTDVLYNSVTGEIYIRLAYQAGETEQTTEQEEWILKFIEYVRPAGVLVTCIPAKFTVLFLDIEGQLWLSYTNITYQVGTLSSIQNYYPAEEITALNCNCFVEGGTPESFYGDFVPEATTVASRGCMTCPIFSSCVSGIGVNEIVKYLPARAACYSPQNGTSFYSHYVTDQAATRGCTGCTYYEDCKAITPFSSEV